MRKQRDTAAAFHLAGPLEVLAHACSAWMVVEREDFTDGEPYMAYDTVEQTTADGRFGFARAASATGGVEITGVPGIAGYLRATRTLWLHSRVEPWRVEVTFAREPNTSVALLLSDTADYAYIEVACTSTATALQVSGDPSLPADVHMLNMPTPAEDQHATRIAVEGRGRWVYAYIGERLIGVLAWRSNPVFASPVVGFDGAGTVKSMLVRQMAPYLRDTSFLRWAFGDRRLPGSPPPSGLTASYYSLAESVSKGAGWEEEALSPIAKPVATRVETAITHPASSAPTWPPAAAGRNFAARWTGAIRLPLATNAIRLRALCFHGVRVTLGGRPRTFFPLYIGSWPTTPFAPGSGGEIWGADVAGHLGQSDTGWYPIIVEYFWTPDVAGSSQTAQLEVEYELDRSGVWLAIGDEVTPLAPYGIFDGHSRLDSLWELRRAVVESFGYQHRLLPRSLESGQFPGVLEASARVGRDTEKVLCSLDEATDAQQEIDAADVCDTLLVDAAGIADEKQGAQLTYEAMDVGALGDGHVFLHSDQDSAAEITDKTLLEQRASSLAALRDSPWTQVQTKPAAADEVLRDATFKDGIPVLGALARFGWQPGDGLRLALPDIAVSDLTPRQITAITWPVLPGGHGAPTVAFRQRPRGLRDTWYRLLRRQAAQAGHYQGQLAQLAGTTGFASPTANLGDQYSRLVLPVNLARVVALELHVNTKTDNSAKTIEVNGVASALSVSAVGVYDITAAVAHRAPGAAAMYARLTGGTGGHEIVLKATVLI